MSSVSRLSIRSSKPVSGWLRELDAQGRLLEKASQPGKDMATRSVNVMLTAAGRRVSLVRAFQKAMHALNLGGSIYAGDASLSAPAAFVADDFVLLPRVDSPNYIKELLSICADKDIQLVASTIDTDLCLLAQHHESFAARGIKLLVSSEATTRICANKLETYKFFTKSSIATPRVYSEAELATLSEADLPVVVKPAAGSCSIGVEVASTLAELRYLRAHTKNPVCQPLIKGDEYTCDAYVDFNGKVRCIVPRLRIETRAGEVSKGVTVRSPAIISAVTDCVEKLPGAIGCITVQCFQQADGKILFIEINPRFGGGHPLSIQAGANFPKWILQELVSGQCDASLESWEDNLVMLRYDDEVFVSRSHIIDQIKR